MGHGGFGGSGQEPDSKNTQVFEDLRYEGEENRDKIKSFQKMGNIKA